MKNTSLLALLAAVAVSSPALADDWSGVYVGGSVGQGSGDSDARVSLSGNWSVESAGLRTDVTNGWSRKLEPDGTSFGAYAGVNHQFDTFVLGAELGFESLNLEDTQNRPSTPAPSTPSVSYAFSNSVKAENAWSIRGRAGLAMGTWMPYLSLGYMSADVETSAAVLSSQGYSKLGTKSDTGSGVTYGVGAEVKLGTNWSVRGEYERIDLGDVTFDTAYRPGSTFVTTPPYTETIKQDVTANRIRVGASYRF